MDLIIKPTESCNFKCTFCSSSEITSVDRTALLPLDRISDFLDEHPNTRTIIVNGGDPLMVKPDYYWSIIEELERREMSSTILSFTTNLWAFYVKPDKWVDLFNHPQVTVTTSFQYGEGRLKGDGTPYTALDFYKVSELFMEKTGKPLDFISVVATKDDLKTAIKNVKLAKSLDVECKLNYAMASGRQSMPLLLADIYKIYVEIYKKDLLHWEYNTKDIIKSMRNIDTSCPRNRKCDEGIRCLQPEGDEYYCGSFGDDKEYSVGDNFRDDPSLISMRPDCFLCPLFNLCNGCAKTIKDHKTRDMDGVHCFKMKQLEPQLLEMRDDPRI